MQEEPAITLDLVSKKYCRTLKRSMLYGVHDISRNMLGLGSHSERLRKGEFWAVEDLSLEVKAGEALGIIGPNGAGKTTILKMLNGIFWPDKGRITIRGRVGALIEVGAGFHPLLTGRENIYVNGAILGMSKREVEEKFEAIVEFADVGEFIDAPVKHYSSGMFVRLGFAVAVHGQPDVLLVDEVLAVGDKEFQIKCYHKMHEVRSSGTTIILVSHNEYTIREQTDTCLYLDQGRVKYQGSSEEGISFYLMDIQSRREDRVEAGMHPQYAGTKKAELTTLRLYDGDWNEIDHIESGQELNIVLECKVRERLEKPIFGVNFYDGAGFMYCANNHYEQVDLDDIPLGKVRIKVNIPAFHLPLNRYLISTVIAEKSPENLIDWRDMEYRLLVGRARNARGSIKLPTSWSVEGV